MHFLCFSVKWFSQEIQHYSKRQSHTKALCAVLCHSISKVTRTYNEHLPIKLAPVQKKKKVLSTSQIKIKCNKLPSSQTVSELPKAIDTIKAGLFLS